MRVHLLNLKNVNFKLLKMLIHFPMFFWTKILTLNVFDYLLLSMAFKIYEMLIFYNLFIRHDRLIIIHDLKEKNVLTRTKLVYYMGHNVIEPSPQLTACRIARHWPGGARRGSIDKTIEYVYEGH